MELNSFVKKATHDIIKYQKSQEIKSHKNAECCSHSPTQNYDLSETYKKKKKTEKYLKIMEDNGAIKSTERLYDFRRTIKEIIDHKNHGKPYKDTPEEIGVHRDLSSKSIDLQSSKLRPMTSKSTYSKG